MTRVVRDVLRDVSRDVARDVSGAVKLRASWARLRRWEFWPRGLFYAPMVPVLAWLALRHRSLTAWTAANTCMPHGGVVGERKSDVLRLLPPEWTMPFELIDAHDADGRLGQFVSAVTARGWSFPMIAKPDAGERGLGVRLLRDERSARRALFEHNEPLIIQPYHPGPYEAGVFFVREPGSPEGRIFSVTDKHFASVTGDGISSLRMLIWNNARYRMQAERFLQRLGVRADDVPAAGERVPLGIAGNHCQGTMFADGEHLITPGLTKTFQHIAASVPGFHFGRFDVRYEDPARFARGQGFAIVELNGVSSESTNIYDPAGSLLRAYATLMRQWDLAFRIGRQNAARGASVSGLRELWRTIRAHHMRRISALSD